MKVPLLNFVGGPGTPLFYVERGPGVPFLNFRGSRVPLLNFKGGPGSGVLGPGPTFTPCRRPEVFCRKGVLRNFEKLTGKHLCQSLFFNKIAGFSLVTLLKVH